jgi:integrase
MSRITLPNGCECTQPNVWPANWRTKKASIAKDWYVTYRFYDPIHKKEFPNGKLVMTKKMNIAKTLEDRQKITEGVIEAILYHLLHNGYNPITKKSIPPIQADLSISPETFIADALQFAYDNSTHLSKNTLDDVGYMLTRIKEAITRTNLMYLRTSDTRRRHVLALLKDCERNNDRWSGYMFNNYRAYLMGLFKILVKFEALEFNPVDENIEKAIIIKKVRRILTADERKKVREKLAEEPDFRRLFLIFFHSGGRLTELCTIKKEDTNIDKQEYKAVIKKGKLYKEVLRPIKNIAVPYWDELLRMAKPGDYLFGRGLRPNEIPCDPEFLTKKWRQLVKEGLGIDVDLYASKHLNLTEISEILSEQEAARQAGHTSTAMVAKIYNINHQSKKDEALKRVNNEF